MNGAMLIIVLILMGGAIAYTGDNIGMRVGRKRLSLFGLRPKYTSIIITVVTGTLIAAATVSVLMFVSVDVRSALFQMKEIKTELVTTKSALSQSESRLKVVSEQVEGLQVRMEDLTEQINVKTREYNDLVVIYDNLKNDYRTLNSDYQSLMANYDGLKVEYGQLSSDYDSLSSNFFLLDEDFKELQNEYDTLNTKYENLGSSYKELQTKYTSLQEKYLILDGNYQELNSKYSELIDSYEDLNGKYEQLIQDYNVLKDELYSVSSERDKAREELVALEEEKKSLLRELADTEEALVAARKTQEELNEQIQKLQEEKLTLVEEVTKLNIEVQSAKAAAEGWKAGFEGMLKSDIVYRADEIILSSIIEGGRSREDISKDMMDFMTRANTLAFQRGARIQGDNVDAIWWIDQDINQAYRQLEHEIKGKAVVRLLSALNTVRGEPVHAYFQIIPDGKVFDAGQIIVKRRMNGKESVEVIQNELFVMLFEVNTIAIRNGMDSGEQGTVGIVSAVELQNAIEQIRTAQAQVEVSVVAVDETWRSGELKIKFKVDYLLIK